MLDFFIIMGGLVLFGFIVGVPLFKYLTPKCNHTWVKESEHISESGLEQSLRKSGECPMPKISR